MSVDSVQIGSVLKSEMKARPNSKILFTQQIFLLCIYKYMYKCDADFNMFSLKKWAFVS